MPSGEFQRIVRDLAVLGDTCESRETSADQAVTPCARVYAARLQLSVRAMPLGTCVWRWHNGRDCYPPSLNASHAGSIGVSKEGVKFHVKGDLGTGNIMRKSVRAVSRERRCAGRRHPASITAPYIARAPPATLTNAPAVQAEREAGAVDHHRDGGVHRGEGLGVYPSQSPCTCAAPHSVRLFTISALRASPSPPPRHARLRNPILRSSRLRCATSIFSPRQRRWRRPCRSTCPRRCRSWSSTSWRTWVRARARGAGRLLSGCRPQAGSLTHARPAPPRRVLLLCVQATCGSSWRLSWTARTSKTAGGRKEATLCHAHDRRGLGPPSCATAAQIAGPCAWPI